MLCSWLSKQLWEHLWGSEGRVFIAPAERHCKLWLIWPERFCQATFSAIYWNCWFTWRAHAPEKAVGTGEGSLSSVSYKSVCNYGAVIGRLPFAEEVQLTATQCKAADVHIECAHTPLKPFSTLGLSVFNALLKVLSLWGSIQSSQRRMNWLHSMLC